MARDLAARIRNVASGSVDIALVANPPGAGVFTDPAPGEVELACTVAAGDTACTAPGPLTIPAASMLFMRVRANAGAVPGTAYWGVTVEPAG